MPTLAQQEPARRDHCRPLAIDPQGGARRHGGDAHTVAARAEVRELLPGGEDRPLRHRTPRQDESGESCQDHPRQAQLPAIGPQRGGQSGPPAPEHGRGGGRGILRGRQRVAGSRRGGRDNRVRGSLLGGRDRRHQRGRRPPARRPQGRETVGQRHLDAPARAAVETPERRSVGGRDLLRLALPRLAEDRYPVHPASQDPEGILPREADRAPQLLGLGPHLGLAVAQGLDPAPHLRRGHLPPLGGRLRPLGRLEFQGRLLEVLPDQIRVPAFGQAGVDEVDRIQPESANFRAAGRVAPPRARTCRLGLRHRRWQTLHPLRTLFGHARCNSFPFKAFGCRTPIRLRAGLGLAFHRNRARSALQARLPRPDRPAPGNGRLANRKPSGYGPMDTSLAHERSAWP